MSVGFVKNDPRLAFDDASHTYTLGERRLVSVTQVLGLTGLADFSQPWFSDVVKDRGTALHRAIALDIEERLDEESIDDPQVLGGLTGWRAFLAAAGAEVEQCERQLCDPEMGVAGRLDCIVVMADAAGRRWRYIVDIKRSLYPCAAIQLAGYLDMAAALYDGPVHLRRAALVLPGDGTYTFHPFTDHTDRATWQAAVRVVNWRRANGLA
ncbi:MAG: hypothetical protein ABI652_04035 [Acidobacteriota bacterium]